MAYESSRSIIRQKIHEAGQCFFNYELETEDKIAILTKFRDLDDDGDGKISFRELRNLRRTMDPALADSICSLFELADRDGNGVLDLDECKALIFLIINRSCCCLCKNLILRDGVSCLDCPPQDYKDFCSDCVLYHCGYHHRYKDIQPLISSSLLQLLPPTIALQAPRIQNYPEHALSLPLLLSSRRQFEYPPGYEIVVARQNTHRNNNNNTRSLMHTAGHVVSTLGHVANVVSLITSCSIM